MMHPENSSSPETSRNFLSRNILQIVMISGGLLLFIVASVLIILFVQSRPSPTSTGFQNTTTKPSVTSIQTTTAQHENISSAMTSSTTANTTPSSITKGIKNRCPSIEAALQFTSDLDLPLDSPTTRNVQRTNIIGRKRWGASTVEYERIELNRPEYVIMSHTLQESCDDINSCSQMVRELQKFDIEEMRLDDIRYNFLVGGDGSIYEGRGWNVAGQHTDGFNNISLSIALIGDYNKDSIGWGQYIFLHRLLNSAVDIEKVTKDFKLVGQCQVDFSTDSPGRSGYKFISKHEHWAQNP